MAEIKLNAKKREVGKKSTLKKLRDENYVPGVFYISEKEPISIYVGESNLRPLVYTTEAHRISLNVEEMDENLDCVLKDVQFDPLTDKMIHFDLRGLTKGEKIIIEIPVNIVGTAPGIKEGGNLQVGFHKLEVECLPKDIPEHIDVDVSNLNIGDSIYVSDLEFENIDIQHDDSVVVVGVVAPSDESEEPELEEEFPDEEEAEGSEEEAAGEEE